LINRKLSHLAIYYPLGCNSIRAAYGCGIVARTLWRGIVPPTPMLPE